MTIVPPVADQPSPPLPGASGAAKVLVAFQLREMAWALAAAGYRRRHPEWTEDAVEAAVREAIARARA